jgi:4-aminobutyrate aminotransferase
VCSSDLRDSREPANEAVDRVLYRSLAKGLSFKTTMGNVLTLTPSLITTRKDMDFALKVIDESLHEVERELGYA